MESYYNEVILFSYICHMHGIEKQQKNIVQVKGVEHQAVSPRLHM